MNVALIFSILLHAGVLALAVFGLPKLARDEVIENRLVVVDVVTVAEVTNAPPPVEKTTPDKTPPPPPDSASQPDRTPPPPPPPVSKPAPPPSAAEPAPPPPAPKETAKPAPAPAPTQAAEAAPPPEPAPAVKAEPVPVPSAKPEPPKPEPEKPEPVPVEKPTPDVPKPEVPKPEQPDVAKVERVEEVAPAPVPVARPTPPERPKQVAEKEAPKTQEPEKKTDNFLNVLKTVQNLKTEAAKPATESPPSPMPEAETTARRSSFDPSQKLSVSEMDAIRQQISSCWLVPAGAKNAADLVVEIEVTMNPDRTVRSSQVVDTSRMQSDPFYRSAAESALRALKSPNCSPLQLPPEKYDTWKSFTITFDPKDMLS